MNNHMNNPSNEKSGQAIKRRRFIQLSAIGSALGPGLGLVSPKAFAATPSAAAANPPNGSTSSPVPLDPEIEELLKTKNPYKRVLTPSAEHGTNYHAKTKPWTLTAEEVKAVGLDRDSYSLEIVLKDGESQGAFLDQPRTIAAGNAITHADLVRLMEQRPVKFLKTMVCTNGPFYGSALWEGVALRDVLWLAKPRGAIRRITFFSPDLADMTKVQWRTSRSTSQVFENPPGLPPPFLALKFNGDWLPLLNGGPVRLIVPENYGTENIKYLRKIVISHDDEVLDSETTLTGGNDMETPMKSCAMKFVNLGKNEKVPHDKPLVLIGIAQTGESSLRMGQIAIVPAPPGSTETANTPPGDDPYLDKLPWKDAAILPPPADLATQIPGGTKGVHGFDPTSGKPLIWPIPFFYCYFAAVFRDLTPGSYLAYYRSIDRNGIAQPLPRPFGGKTGVNDQLFHPTLFEVI